ncbi:hypothetical protein [Moellerella wisconsensis]|uniref:Uncharacterized protein n=1 Tax=Moellerella wisconsensis TaxID=158849 RepID=A0A9Q8Q3F1_9GAMM|nr:hypothetical protein [Moellerella wisconsensis]KLN97425.1 hypothetical protein VK86_04895 [Moellerella wisconsensis]UNH31740.1 hypothetical protein MNY72_05435 [Moellerella wisconsensis]UNH43357.1 hypothetical protein MNY66_05095 [Moellerella wisconsensis]WJW82747.1 hypothetical protein QU516_04800 [Moellerella wisconsensis]
MVEENEIYPTIVINKKDDLTRNRMKQATKNINRKDMSQKGYEQESQRFITAETYTRRVITQ